MVAVSAESLAPPGAALDAQLEEFLASDYPRVVAAVALITGSREAAEDAVQDAIVTTLARPPRHDVQSLPAWITVVATNEARMRHRRSGAEARAVARTEPPGEAADPADAVAAQAPIADALATLPLQQRQVCVMHYYLDASVASIASELKVSEGTVKTQLHRARGALAPVLGVSEEDGNG